MKSQKPIKLIPFETIKRRMLKDPETKRLYDELDMEYKLIEALIKKRSQKKLTQKALAEKIGVEQSALARFESGRVSPTLSFVKKVTAGLGLRLVVK
ncbi:MAG: helix-turn-helix transcriptional regulator [bacterium]|nr:helix-turn-helix transcriptional regulator [bacterium]